MYQAVLVDSKLFWSLFIGWKSSINGNDKKLQGSGKGNNTAKIYNDYEYLEAGEKKGK